MNDAGVTDHIAVNGLGSENAVCTSLAEAACEMGVTDAVWLVVVELEPAMPGQRDLHLGAIAVSAIVNRTHARRRVLSEYAGPVR